MDKNSNIKTRSTKIFKYTAEEVAGIVGCSVSMVKKVRSGALAKNTPLRRRVALVDEVLADGSSKLLAEVERILRG